MLTVKYVQKIMYVTHEDDQVLTQDLELLLDEEIEHETQIATEVE